MLSLSEERVVQHAQSAHSGCSIPSQRLTACLSANVLRSRLMLRICIRLGRFGIHNTSQCGDRDHEHSLQESKSRSSNQRIHQAPKFTLDNLFANLPYCWPHETHFRFSARRLCRSSCKQLPRATTRSGLLIQCAAQSPHRLRPSAERGGNMIPPPKHISIASKDATSRGISSCRYQIRRMLLNVLCP